MVQSTVRNAKTVVQLIKVMDFIEDRIMTSAPLRTTDPVTLPPVMAGAFKGSMILIGEIDGYHGVYLIE